MADDTSSDSKNVDSTDEQPKKSPRKRVSVIGRLAKSAASHVGAGAGVVSELISIADSLP